MLFVFFAATCVYSNFWNVYLGLERIKEVASLAGTYSILASTNQPNRPTHRPEDCNMESISPISLVSEKLAEPQ